MIKVILCFHYPQTGLKLEKMFITSFNKNLAIDYKAGSKNKVTNKHVNESERVLQYPNIASIEGGWSKSFKEREDQSKVVLEDINEISCQIF